VQDRVHEVLQAVAAGQVSSTHSCYSGVQWLHTHSCSQPSSAAACLLSPPRSLLTLVPGCCYVRLCTAAALHSHRPASRADEHALAFQPAHGWHVFGAVVILQDSSVSVAELAALKKRKLVVAEAWKTYRVRHCCSCCCGCLRADGWAGFQQPMQACTACGSAVKWLCGHARRCVLTDACGVCLHTLKTSAVCCPSPRRLARAPPLRCSARRRPRS